MALRSFESIPYLPFLSLRPAEMRALEELPNNTKDRILPLVHLRPWTTAHLLQSALDRLNEAYGKRPTIVAIGSLEPTSTIRPVHEELDQLRLPAEGYAKWCQFIAKPEHDHFSPAVQIDDIDHINQQVECFYELGRGIDIIVRQAAYPALSALARRIAALTNGGVDTCFILDEGTASRDVLQRAAFLVSYCQIVIENCPEAALSISASSFPDSFKDLSEQEIFERTLFNNVSSKLNSVSLIYSDRGSARVERQQGGGGLPAPRIDYPQAGRWRFYRSDNEGFAGYQEQAEALIDAEPPVFDPILRVWGTLMIERTANGDSSAIKTPARSTAVRINLHLQRQAFFGDPIGLYDTEDDWSG